MWRKQGVTVRKQWGGEMGRRVLGRRVGKENVREKGGERGEERKVFGKRRHGGGGTKGRREEIF